MAFQSFMATLLACLQMIGVMFGIVPVENRPVDYGGGEYVEKVVEEYLTLIDNGESKYRIIIPANASDTVKTASNELQKYLEKISGVKLTIAEDTSDETDYEIVLGTTNRETSAGVSFEYEKLGDEGFTLLVKNNKLFIAGSDKRGTLYGVYTFLEEQLGCRWFTPELTKIPETKTVKIDAKLNDTQCPVFEYRYTDWNSKNDITWSVAHKLNGSPVPEKMGGYISYDNYGHSMATLVPGSLYDEHPEYFAYRISEDARVEPTLDNLYSQRCLSNPDVVAVTIENARKQLRNNPKAKMLSITQNDNHLYCECDQCTALAEKYGGQGGLNLWFVNQVAKAIKDEFPNVLVDTFAYQYTRTAPKNIVAEDNVCVRVCTIECCFCHPIEECGHERNESKFVQASYVEPTVPKDIKGWGEISKNVYVWDYTTNFYHYMQIFPNFHVLADNMQFFAENGVTGLYEEGNYNSGKNNGEFGEMKAYIISKLLWNPYQNVEHLMDEFMDAYYGEASAIYIKKYIDFITNKVKASTHLFIFNWHYDNGYFTFPEIFKMNLWWKAAKDNAQTEEQLYNIRSSELSYRYYKSTMFTGEFSIFNPIRYRIENEKLYNDMKELGITRINESTLLPDEKPDFWQRPFDWGE